MENLPVETQGLKELASIQLDLSILEEDEDITSATKLSFTKIAALGTGFEPIVTAFQWCFQWDLSGDSSWRWASGTFSRWKRLVRHRFE